MRNARAGTGLPKATDGYAITSATMGLFWRE
jgi:hypothetical protein